MRKIVAAEFMSLDGVVESPEKWHFPYFNDEMGQAVGEGFATSDAMLMGRVLYEEWAAYWPLQNPEENPIAAHINGVSKYVVSTTLEEPLEWDNSTLIKRNVSEGIAGLKEQPGKDITVSGSGAPSGRCSSTASSTSFGSWFIPSSLATASASSRTEETGRGWNS